MASKRWAAVVALIGVLLVAWYLFRPERALLDRRVDEPAPAGVARVLFEGAFEDRGHRGTGRAAILELESGERVLRFEDFDTLDGPDLFVYLIGSPAASTDADLDAGGYVSLGELKGNVGPQNYSIPAEVDLAAYRAVSVWCRRFSVNFTTARLGAADGG